MARITRKSVGKLAIVTGLGSLIVACSSSNDPGSTGANVGGRGAGTSVGGGAGTKATGGSGAQVGGATSTGGSSTSAAQGGNTAQTGGTTSVTPATGGASTGGTPANTGGAATGGAATGGSSATPAGGSATGGAATGGAATGGSSATGTGGAATGGASSCAAATITKVSASDYQIKLCDVTMDVNPQVGARVSKLTLTPTGSSTATNIIQPYTCASYDPNSTCNNSGSTFWTSPQTAWNWPPVAAIDGNAYTPTINGNHLSLKGSADATLGAGVTKDISPDSATGWITLTYTIDATKAIQAAPWQITRVPRGGLVFFPMISLINNSNSLTTWTLLPSGGNEWIDDKNQTSVTSSGPKIIADGGVSGQSYAWLAYALNGNLLLIKYPDVLAGSFAANEGDTEVYPGNGYIELEAQGAYAPIAANTSSSSWSVQWRVVAIPTGMSVIAGSTALSTFAAQQAAM